MSGDVEEDIMYIEDHPECEKYMAEFLAGRNLYDYTAKDIQRREEHDITYHKYVRRDDARQERRRGEGAPKKYREEIYNKESTCDSKFINNVHTYRTCDGGSGYRAEQKHYAVDFVLDKNACDKPELTSNLKKLKVYSKNKTINEWLNKKCPYENLGLRRAVSCINFRPESLEIETNRAEIAEFRRFKINNEATIDNLDATFMPEECFELDMGRVFHEIALCFKHMMRHVNALNWEEGQEVKISKVLFSTDDHYAYVIQQSIDIRKTLVQFSKDFHTWKSNSSKEYPGYTIDDRKTTSFFVRVNVVLFLEEFIEDGTAFRRARHIYRLPDNFDTPRRDLYLELDTGMLRILSSTPDNVKVLPSTWAHTPTPILEVRFHGAKTAEDVAMHISSIRSTGKAIVRSVDRCDRQSRLNHAYKKWLWKNWSSVDTVVLQTFKPYTKSNLTTYFCEDKDCTGMCGSGSYLKMHPHISDVAPTLEKLKELREQFSADDVLLQINQPLDAYILPLADAHQNQNIPGHYARLKFLSGFDGSVGSALITRHEALLWTDNQHFRLAQREVDTNHWTIKNQSERATDTMVDWIKRHLPPGSIVGVDPALVTFEYFVETAHLLKLSDIRLVGIPRNLIDSLWKNRPFREGDVVKVMGLGECGRMPGVKLDQLKSEVKSKRCSAIIICALDEIMWLLNIRGNDIEIDSLTYSYLFVTEQQVNLFIDLEKLDKNAQMHLTRTGVTFHAYRTVHTFISDWWEKQKELRKNPPPKPLKDNEEKKLVGPLRPIYVPPKTNYWIASIFEEIRPEEKKLDEKKSEKNALQEGIPEEQNLDETWKYVVTGPSIVEKVKARKNKTELIGMRACNLRHSVAIVEFLHWIHKEANDGRRYTELQLSEKIEEFKKCDDTYIGPSIPTIVFSGVNSSKIAHEPVSSLTVANMQQFVLQSGGHYKDGSTMTARTVWDSERSEEFASKYTLVLKGHIAVSSVHFPDHVTQGSRLDVFARTALWNVGEDFDHATGHNVGHRMQVKDLAGPTDGTDGVLEAGQVISLEPGFYKPDEFGIRIGNCYETLPAPVQKNQVKPFLEFKPLTLIPIQTSNIISNLLSSEDIFWINNYNYRVFAQIGAVLRDEKKLDAFQWLEVACQPIATVQTPPATPS